MIFALQILKETVVLKAASELFREEKDSILRPISTFNIVLHGGFYTLELITAASSIYMYVLASQDNEEI